MRFLVAAGTAILVVAAARSIDVGHTTFGAQREGLLGLPIALWGFVVYGVGLALLFFATAAHFALRGAKRRLSRSHAAPLAVAAFLAGAAIAAFVPWSIVHWLAQIVPDQGERTRLIAFTTVANLHLIVDGLLLIALGLRLARIRPPAAA